MRKLTVTAGSLAICSSIVILALSALHAVEATGPRATTTPSPTPLPPGALEPRFAEAAALVQELIDAENRGDLPRAMALMTDDVRFTGSVGKWCASLCRGKPAVQREIEFEIANHFSIAGWNVTDTAAQLFGVAVGGPIAVSGDMFADAGMDGSGFYLVVVTRDDKISGILLLHPRPPSAQVFDLPQAGTRPARSPGPDFMTLIAIGCWGLSCLALGFGARKAARPR